MKKIVIICLSLLLTTSLTYAAGDVPSADIWGKLRAKIEKLTPTKKQPVTTAVGGVRGAEVDAKEDLYWKGEEKNISVTESELASFKSAVTMAEKGKKQEAAQAFSQFVTQYPQSSLGPDALEAIKMLN